MVQDGDNDDGFEVEFSSSGAWRGGARNNVVNKISAVTFQQIGRTASESYVMKPVKSWSAVVGKPSVEREETKPDTDVDVDVVDTVPIRESTIHDMIKMKMKEGVELTGEEREILRQKRRDRRVREKEKKRKEKEEKMRQDMLRPQTTKLNIISGDVLNLVNNSSNTHKTKINQNKSREIKFLDEEYPDLGVRTKQEKHRRVISTEIRDEQGAIQVSDRESNSEWETEDDGNKTDIDVADNEDDHEKIEVVKSSGPISYSSILKSSKKAGILKVKPEVIKDKKEEETFSTAEKKKVKKKDPLLLDLTSALVVKSRERKKTGSVVTGKLKRDGAGGSKSSVRNKLDSTAPARKRGKEREGGKKKKKTVMKKIIIAEREKRRHEAEMRREERIQKGIVMKPLPVKEDEEVEENISEHKQESTDAIDENTEAQQDNVVETHEVVSESPAAGNEDKAIDAETSVGETESEIVQKSLESSVEEKALQIIHSRKFRTYCDHLLSPELNNSISLLMADLIR